MTTPVPPQAGAPPHLTVGVLQERADHERRVALTPDGVTRLATLGLGTLLETGAGVDAWFPDTAYTDTGARVADLESVCAESDIVVCVNAPDSTTLDLLRPGQALIGLLQPLTHPELVQRLAEAKVTVLSLDGLPRTLSRAQSMDALTSQANVAGYKAALVAADAYASYLPMLMTAAGTIRPARVLVIGAGVAGLQAIGTARRLGAVVTGYDVRDAARADVASTGASFLTLPSALSTAGENGYARELTPEERDRQQAEMAAAVGAFDIVITTAQVPGRRPPQLVSAAALAALRPGSVVVDLAASALGGNVAGSIPEATTVTGNGVTVIGAGNLAATVPMAASTAYSRNIAALLGELVRGGELMLDTANEVTAGVLVAHDGAVLHPAVVTLAASPTVSERNR